MKTHLKRFDFSGFQIGFLKPSFAAPFIDFVLISGLIFCLSQNRLLYSQGIPIDFPRIESGSEIIDGVSCLGVLSIDKNGMFFLDGERFSYQNLGDGLDRLDKALVTKPTLLVKAERNVGIDSFVQVCELLASRGIEAVLVAVSEKPRP